MSSNQQGNSELNFVQVHTAEMDKEYNPKQSLKKSLISSKIYKQYPYRWVIMIFYQAAIFLNGMAYETCIPNTIQFSQLYNVSDQVITATATVYMLMHPLLTFAASSVIVNKGFAYSVNVGAISTIIGFAIRLLINKSSFYFVILGQVFTGFGRPFILNAQATMAQNWFYPSSRTAVLTISNTIQTLSIVASLLMPANLFFNKYDYNGDNKEEGLKISFNLMLWQFLMSLLLIPGLFLLRSNAPTPPSGFANTDKNISFKQAVLKLFKNRNFNIIFITFSIYFGNLKGFGLIIPYLMRPFGFIDSQYSITGAVVILGGLISSAFISKIVLLFKKYKLICAVLMVASIFSCGFLYGALTTEIIQMVYGVALVLGFFLVPLAPVLLEYGCEAIYPINGSFAVGLLISGATLLTVVSSQVLTAVVKGKNSDSKSVLITIIVMISTLVGGLILFFFSKEILNRTQEVRARSILQKSAFFKSKVLKQSVKNEDFKDEDDLKQGIGDYPTEHPFIDPHRFIANPEVFNPDVIADLQDDDDNK